MTNNVSLIWYAVCIWIELIEFIVTIDSKKVELSSAFLNTKKKTKSNHKHTNTL